MAKDVVNSYLTLAINFMLAEKSRLRSSPLLQTAIRFGRLKRKVKNQRQF